jgi:hypothetical protein
MTMSPVEVFVLCGAGYVCGLASASGFVMSALLQLYVNGRAAWRSIAWFGWMAINTMTAGLIPVFLIGALVVGDQPGRPDFWPRALLFGFGVVVGLTFILFSIHLIGRKLKDMLPMEGLNKQA